ncbi:MAG: family 78 glycoside hydrolase catalytic domain [Clostridia bacterium]|nr:family 78 glycoside hydrolase catalytic domain [Clostridia bacterium]
MFTSAKWIGSEAGELGFRQAEIRSFRQRTERRDRILAGNEPDPTRRGSVLFRKDFLLSAPAEKAVLSIAGLGFYRLSVNGVSPDENRVLPPIVSDYSLRVKYDDYDVARLLHEGKNRICVEVGPGWFTGNPKYWGWQQFWYGNPRLIAELAVTYRNGAQELIVTDGAWRTADGNVTVSCVYDGETQDLSIAPKDWTEPDFDASDWRSAAEVEAPRGDLTRCEAPPVRITRVLSPVSQKQLSPVETLYDFGENGAAIPCVRVRGKKGDTVTLRHAEFLKDDGTLDRHSENRAECTDRFLLADDTPVVLSPKFTWHGYRYMTVTLSSQDILVERAESCVIHSDVKQTGSFECSREDLNELHRAYVRSMLACLQGVPVDCPQRDERKAWLGDAYAVSEACLYNFDMRSLYADWLEDLRGGAHSTQRTIPYIAPGFGDGDASIDWNLAYPVILTECYERYRDDALLRRHYETLRAHTEYYISAAKDGMIGPCFFGDWCTPDRPDGQEQVAFCAGGEDHRQNPPFAATVFYAQTLRLAARIAERTGHEADAARFRAEREKARQALLDRYFDSATGRFGSGGQFLQTFLLAEELVEEKDRPAAVAALLRELEEHDYHPYVGVLGLRRIYDLLFSLGKPEEAYRLLTAQGYPGQLHMLSGGRTTLTERLDFEGSGDHCMFASPDTVFYKYLGGITVDRTSAVSVKIAPYCPDELSFVRCSQTLPEGEIRVEWRKEADGVVFDVWVPQGLSARVSLRTPADAYEETLPNGGNRRVALKT